MGNGDVIAVRSRHLRQAVVRDHQLAQFMTQADRLRLGDVTREHGKLLMIEVTAQDLPEKLRSPGLNVIGHQHEHNQGRRLNDSYSATLSA